ncbi:MAG: hypothetical protein BGO09_03470 [Bacteroidetes bacterium 47-18]|nr:MAG: hypothetical protein BGO09_03470 [Bacteroidetes bacterium 47-18]
MPEIVIRNTELDKGELFFEKIFNNSLNKRLERIRITTTGITNENWSLFNETSIEIIKCDRSTGQQDSYKLDINKLQDNQYTYSGEYNFDLTNDCFYICRFNYNNISILDIEFTITITYELT